MTKQLMDSYVSMQLKVEGMSSMAWQSGDGLISQLVESQLSQSVEVLVII